MTSPTLQALVDRFDPAALELDRPARVRLAMDGEGAWDALIGPDGVLRLEYAGDARPDALLRADAATWKRIAEDLRGGMDAFRARRLRIRHNLNLGVGFLAATGGNAGPGRLRFRRLRTRRGTLSAVEAGVGAPLVLLHGLGGTKVSFLPTIAALGGSHRMVAVDLPGFGDSDKPLGRYDPGFLARWVIAALDALELERTHLLGHSLGGRVALEVAFDQPGRIDALVLMTPSLAWLRERRWASWLRVLRPELGLLQPTPRPLVEPVVRRLIPGARGDGWAAVAVDEFLRGYLTARGRQAFYATARNIYLEDPDSFWTRLRALAPDSLFIWGRHDPMVPIGFMRHVEAALPSARHVELECGHIPQLEAPAQAHRAIADFLEEHAPSARPKPDGSVPTDARPH
ncbi:MAG TPA: alpha/beta fold hydrolase [Solirubrobacteraceae bacterium]|jgi:pimeloyl-ACP methyl ester carboxylesterase|nr:alpha/beta fold hydrolase [Solirubrobacteraceae bacterium]